MKNTGSLAVAVLCCGAIAGCVSLLGDYSNGTNGPGADGGIEAGTDAEADAQTRPLPDAQTDAGADAGLDAGSTGTDAGAEAAPPSCTPGGACSTPCGSGTYVCADGGLTCNLTTKDPDGTACGSNDAGVCTSGVCNCPSGDSLCGTTCSDPTTDVANCGYCGHACGAGSTCTSGYCIPQTVCTGAGNSGTMWALGTQALILDGKEIASCDLTATGGTATEVYGSLLNGFSMVTLSGDSKIAYFTSHLVTNDSNGLYSTDGTNAGTTYVMPFPTAFDATYVTTTTDITTGSEFIGLQTTVNLVKLSEASDAGVPVLTCIDNLQSLKAIAAAGGRLFAADGTGNDIVVDTVTNGLSCSTSSTFASGLSSPSVVVTDGNIVAFADANGVYACNASLGCIPQASPAPLVAGQGASTIETIVIDQASPPNLYWIGSSGLVTCSSDASACNGKPHVLVPNAAPTYGMTVDATFVYYLQGSILYKVAK